MEEIRKEALELNIATLLSMHPEPLIFLKTLEAQIIMHTFAKIETQIEQLNMKINGINWNFIQPMNECLIKHSKQLTNLEGK